MKGTLSLRVRPPAPAALALLVALAPSLPAAATVVRGLSLAEKTDVAQLVVLATATARETRWVIEGGSTETRVTVKLDEVLKGKASRGETITLLLQGGEIGEFRHEVPGMSTWSVGEQAVLFLERLPDGLYVELGVGIGKYSVSGPSEARVVTHAPRVALAFVDLVQGTRVEAPTPMKPTKLADFLKEVRSLLTRHKATPKVPTTAAPRAPAQPTPVTPARAPASN
jgi:hypothetical protein